MYIYIYIYIVVEWGVEAIFDETATDRYLFSRSIFPSVHLFGSATLPSLR